MKKIVPVLWTTLLVAATRVVSQATVPDDESYVDDLSFLDFAVDRGENAILCDHLFSMTLMVDLVLFAIAFVVWGIFGPKVESFVRRDKIR